MGLQIIKHLIKVLILFLLIINNNCYAQKLVNTPSDAKKIKENQHLFINKPLKILLNEIVPQIKMASGNPNSSSVGYFNFKFVEKKQSDSIKLKGKTPVTIIVYLKEPFEWEYKKRPIGKELAWTKEDEEKYGNLTVVAFRVYGEE